MRIRIPLPVLLLWVLFSCDLSRASDLVLVGAKIYSSPTETPIENGSILVHDGRILAVGPSASMKFPRAAIVVNCKGLVITVGSGTAMYTSSLRACSMQKNSRPIRSLHNSKTC